MPRAKSKPVSLKQIIREWPYEHPVALPERVRWSQSSLTLFRKCKRKYFWRYIAGIRPRYESRTALLIGGAFHDTVAQWYRGKKSKMRVIAPRYIEPIQTVLEVEGEHYDQNALDKLSQQIATFTGMMMGYEDCYHEDRTNWVIKRKHIELGFFVDCGNFDFVGYIDLLARHSFADRAPFLVEHKTASRIESSYIDRLPLDTQTRSYIFGAIHGHNIKPAHVVYDIVRKSKLRRKANETQEEMNQRIADDYMCRPSFYFFREDLKFKQSDIDAFEFDMHQTHKEYTLYANGHFGDPLDPKTWTPNDSVCYEFFSTCPFMKPCLEGIDGSTPLLFNHWVDEAAAESQESEDG